MLIPSLSPVEKTADDALHTRVSPEQTAKAEAVKFLSEVVATGPVKVVHIEKEARTGCLLGAHQPIGQSKPFRSARKELGIVSYQAKGRKAGGWFWVLPEHVPSDVER